MGENKIPTPHIAAQAGDFADTVLMPGDPKRSAYIARKFLRDARLVNDVRGVQGYTGTFESKRVSVMASGMGMPAIGIYSYELFHFYGVQAIIRVGSAGALSPDLRVRDIVLAQGACTDSAYGKQFALPGSFAPIADYSLLSRAKAEAEKTGVRHAVGNVVSSDVFYGDDAAALQRWRGMGVLAVEMEAAALYMNAARAGKKALCICTISDCPFTGEALSSADREQSFDEMCLLALRTAL